MMPAENISSHTTLNTLLEGIVSIDPASDRIIYGLCMDSRTIEPGCVFFACDGHQVHGIRFAEQAIKNGAAAILWETDDVNATFNYKDFDVGGISVPVIKVKNLQQHIGIIAERFYGNPSSALYTIGITGTNGKTSCSHFIAQALSWADSKSCGLIGTLGSGVYGNLQHSAHTTPDAVKLHSMFDSLRSSGIKQLVMEVSSHGLVQGRVAGVKFDLAVFTNLSRDHLDYHGDMRAYGEAKRRLFDFNSVEHAVINIDDSFSETILENLSQRVHAICYGFGAMPKSCHSYVQGQNLNLSRQGLCFDVNTSWGSGKVQSTLLGQFSASNLMAALGVLLAMNMPLQEAITRIESCQTISGRMERTHEYAGMPMVVVDYAHTPDALEKILNALRLHNAKSMQGQAKLWCVFGCGGDRDQGKRSQMGEIAERLADNVIVTNDNPRTERAQSVIEDILAGTQDPQAIYVETDRRKAIALAIESASVNDLILVAGKGHEQYQIIGNQKIAYPGDRRVAEGIMKNSLIKDKNHDGL